MIYSQACQLPAKKHINSEVPLRRRQTNRRWLDCMSASQEAEDTPESPQRPLKAHLILLWH